MLRFYTDCNVFSFLFIGEVKFWSRTLPTVIGYLLWSRWVVLRMLIAALVILIYHCFILYHLEWTFLQGSCSLLKRLQLIDPTKKRPKSRQKEWREKSMLSLQIFRLTERLFACRRLDVQVPDATDQIMTQVMTAPLPNAQQQVWMLQVLGSDHKLDVPCHSEHQCSAQLHAATLSCSPVLERDNFNQSIMLSHFRFTLRRLGNL